MSKEVSIPSELNDANFIALRSFYNNQYFSIREDNAIWVNRSEVKLFETIRIFKSHCVPGAITLKSAHNKYLSADIHGNVSWDRDGPGDLESFIPEQLDKGVYALKTIRGKYLSVERPRLHVLKPPISCQREKIEENCKFKIEILDLIACYTFKSLGNEKVWRVSRKNSIDCSSNNKKTFESFKLIEMSNNKFALKSHKGTFLSAEGGSVSCSKIVAGEHESFEIVKMDNSLDNVDGKKVMVKSWDGKFVCEKGGRLIIEEKDAPGVTKVFLMEEIFINRSGTE